MKRAVLPIVAIACLAVGFFAGREHVKFQLRQTMAEAFGVFNEGLLGLSGETAEDQVQHRKAEPAKIGIELLGKSFRDSDIMSGRYQEYLNFKLRFINKMKKDLRAFTGVVVFNDLFDREVMSVGLTYENPLAAGDSCVWEGGIEYNEFIDEHLALRAKDKKDLKVDFVLEQAILADGSKEVFGE